MRKGIPITPSVLKWARQSAGYHTTEELTRIFPKLIEWENGESFPTYSQIKELAKKYKRPIAVFFFPEPPQEKTIEKSLRAISENEIYNLTPQIRFLFRKAKIFQINLSELLIDEYLNHLTKIKWLNQDYTLPDMAKRIRNILKVSVEQQSQWKSTGEALEAWRNILADNGIFVFKDAFKNERISGFCIYDDLFPIIYLNNSQSETRQIFTIFHELAHLIFKQNYLDLSEDLRSYNKRSNIESACNAFAGAFLVPEDDFQARIPKTLETDRDIENLANIYKVSKEVIIRKLLDSKKISKSYYESKINELNNLNFINKVSKRGGGSYYYNKLSYLGKSYFELVYRKLSDNKINLEQASDYLDVKSKHFSFLEEVFIKKELSNVRIR